MNIPPEGAHSADPVLKPCPFCGGDAEFERLGTGRQSCIVACGNCGARHESSDEYERSGSSWNQRAAPEGPAPTEPMEWQELKAAALSILLGANPLGGALSSVPTKRLTAIGNALRALAAAPEAPPPVEARQPPEPLSTFLHGQDFHDMMEKFKASHGMREFVSAFSEIRDAILARAALAAPAGAIQPHLDHHVGAPVALSDAATDGRDTRALADPAVDWPCAKLVVSGHGAACDGPPTIVATFYAPGLPDGEHDVWCVPVAPEPAAYFLNDAPEGSPPHYAQVAAEYIGTEGVFPLYRGTP